jgi:hypothetical protein
MSTILISAHEARYTGVGPFELPPYSNRIASSNTLQREGATSMTRDVRSCIAIAAFFAHSLHSDEV